TLIHVADMDVWLFKFRQHPFCEIVIGGKFVSVRPKFVVDKGQFALVVIEDKHFKNKKLTKRTNYREAQLAAEILACSSVNLREIYGNEYVDQKIFAIHIISTYFTFYHAVITGSYLEELDYGLLLPKNHSAVIKRWPSKNGVKEGLNIVEIGRRKAILIALAKL
ncbi:2938_t:CDS:2, partial [Gigaspora rosea]